MNEKKKKQSRIRLIVQAVSFAFHNGYLIGWARKEMYTGDLKKFCVPGLNCYSCPGAVGSCPVGNLQNALGNGSFKAVLYLLGAIGAIGILLGRLVCGWLCPFGWVQDLLHKIPVFKKRKNFPGHKYLKYLKYVILGVFAILLPLVVLTAGTGQPWFCEWICPSGTLFAGIPQVLFHENLRDAAGVRFFVKLGVLLCILIISVKFARPFCKYLCPLGALYGACNPVSTYRLKVDKESCTGCGACENACPMGIKVWETPNSMECIRCGKCMAACPSEAVTSTWKMLLNGRSAEDSSKPAVRKAPAVTFGGKTLALIIASQTALFGTILALYRLCFQVFAGDANDVPTLFAIVCNCVTQLMVCFLMGAFTVKGIRSFKAPQLDEEVRDLGKRILKWTLILRVGVSAVSLLFYVAQVKGTVEKPVDAFVGTFMSSILILLIAAWFIFMLVKPPRKRRIG